MVIAINISTRAMYGRLIFSALVLLTRLNRMSFFLQLEHLTFSCNLSAQIFFLPIYVTQIKAGADQSLTTKNGYTSIDIAHRLGYVSIIENNQLQMPKSDSGNLSSKIVVPETLLESLATDLKQLSEDEDEYCENNNFSSKLGIIWAAYP